MELPKIQVLNLSHLKQLSENKYSVYCPNSFGLLKKPLPATVVLNWQGNLILKCFEKGMYVYLDSKLGKYKNETQITNSEIKLTKKEKTKIKTILKKENNLEKHYRKSREMIKYLEKVSKICARSYGFK